jgi:hypothetical protein
LWPVYRPASQVSLEARQWSHLYQSAEQELSSQAPADETEMHGNAILNERQFSPIVIQAFVHTLHKLNYPLIIEVHLKFI